MKAAEDFLSNRVEIRSMRFVTRTRVALALLVVLAVAFMGGLTLRGQSANTVTAGVPFNFYADQDGQYVASYRVEFQGGPSPASFTAPASARDAQGTITFANCVIAQPGNYQAIVMTIGTNGRVIPSSPFALSVNAPDATAATNLRLVK